jgi:hypothetical protein
LKVTTLPINVIDSSIKRLMIQEPYIKLPTRSQNYDVDMFEIDELDINITTYSLKQYFGSCSNNGFIIFYFIYYQSKVNIEYQNQHSEELKKWK